MSYDQYCKTTNGEKFRACDWIDGPSILREIDWIPALEGNRPIGAPALGVRSHGVVVAF